MNEPSLVELLPRLLLSMIAVIAVMAIAARVLRNRKIPGTGGLRLGNLSSSTNRSVVEVISRHGVTRHASVAVVRAGEKTFMLGVTEQQISLITELDETQLVDIQRTDVDIDADSNLASGQSWTGLLTQVRERTVRR